MKRYEEFINERYKEPSSYSTNSFGWKVPDKTYVDDIFDYLVDIVCEENSISEKNFTKWDQTTEYIRLYVDNNSEILQEMDEYKDKRPRYCAEFLYDKYFNNKKERIQ